MTSPFFSWSVEIVIPSTVQAVCVTVYHTVNSLSLSHTNTYADDEQRPILRTVWCGDGGGVLYLGVGCANDCGDVLMVVHGFGRCMADLCVSPDVLE